MQARFAFELLLKPMTDRSFPIFRDILKNDYAHTMHRAKEVPSLEEGFVKAESQLSEYLSKGLQTADQFLREIIIVPERAKANWSPTKFADKPSGAEANQESVGYIWTGLNFDPFATEAALGNGRSWLHYIYINETKRKQGIASKAMQQLEKELQENYKQQHLAGSVYLDNPPVLNLFRLLNYQLESFPEKGYGFVRKDFKPVLNPHKSM